MSVKDQVHAVAMDAAHTACPQVLVNVELSDVTGTIGPYRVAQTIWGEDLRFQVWLPYLELWTADTVLLVVHELSAYIPTDPEATATVRVNYSETARTATESAHAANGRGRAVLRRGARLASDHQHMRGDN